MRARRIKAAAILTATIGIFLPGSGWSYEVDTHAEMSAAAWNKFYTEREAALLFGEHKFLDLYRLLSPRHQKLGYVYWDMAADGEYLRKVDWANIKDPQLYERRTVRTYAPSSTPPQWILRGAVREDDIGRVLGLNGEVLALKIDNPFDDEYFPRLARPSHHFFDPAKNRPLESASALLAVVEPNLQRSPDWALGFENSFASNPVADATRRNHFSFQDAREAMWRAMTGRRKNGTLAASSAMERKAYWATTFRSLGHVLHHVQDMAQPQHTRNDSHAGVLDLGPASEYEVRMYNRTLAKQVFNWNTGTREMLPPIELGDLAPVTFNNVSSVFSTSIGNVGQGKGLADYSNRNFFTFGTNLGDNDYTLPTNTVASYSELQVAEGLQVRTYLVGTTSDLVYGGPPPATKLTSFSALNKAVTEAGGPPEFEMADEVYDDMASLLIPRAVGYSAGLLGYFFRGTLKLELPAEKVFAVEDFRTIESTGFRTLKVLVKNATKPVVEALTSQETEQRLATGTLVAVLTYRKNTCLTWPSLDGVPVVSGSTSSWNENCRSADEFVVVGNARATGGSPAFTDAINDDYEAVIFDMSEPLPWNAIDVDLHVVYRGKLGSEQDAIAVGFYHINEPTYLDIVNFSDCFAVPATPLPGGSIKLPFDRAEDEPGWRDVVTYPTLNPGQHARVGFLTQQAMREGFPHNTAVHTNQDFGYSLPVRYPDGTTETWPGDAPVIKGAYSNSRKIGIGVDMKSWFLVGSFGTDPTPTGWASQCPTTIDPIPVPVSVQFP